MITAMKALESGRVQLSAAERRRFAGAAAYLLKQTAAVDLVKAIREVKKGNAYFSPAIAQRLREQTCRSLAGNSPAKSPETELTVREAEVLQLIAEGFANKQIAAELGLDPVCETGHRPRIERSVARSMHVTLLR